MSASAATSDAGALLLVFFLLTGTALALIRQREIEREVLYGSSAGPGFRWLGVLAVPLVLIAGASLLVAVGGGPLVRFAGHAALAVGRAIGWVVVAFWRLLPRRQPRPAGHRPGRPRPPSGTGAVPPRTPGGGPRPRCSDGGRAGRRRAGRGAGHLGRRAPRPALHRHRAPGGVGALRRGQRAATGVHLGASPGAGAVGGAPTPETRRGAGGVTRGVSRPLGRRDRQRTSVRPGSARGHFGEYRRVLLAARQAGTPRVPTETPWSSLGGSPRPSIPRARRPDGPGRRSEPLDTLTSLYEQASRYGDARPGESAHHRARQAATEVVTRLESLPACRPTGPDGRPKGSVVLADDGPGAGGGRRGHRALVRLAAGRSGPRVTLVAPDPGRDGASWVAAGMLAPVTEVQFGEAPLTELLLEGARAGRSSPPRWRGPRGTTSATTSPAR